MRNTPRHEAKDHMVGSAARDPVTMHETHEFQHVFQTIWGELQAKVAA